MSSHPLVEIFCEGGKTVGYGHIRRASTLAARLEKDGIDVRISGLSGAARQLLATPKHVGRVAQVVVFDSHVGIDDQICETRKRGQVSIALDWFGGTSPNINIVVYPHGEVRATCKTYIGFKYVLIREDIALLPRTPPIGSANRALVVLGGGDILEQGHQVSRYLHDLGLDVTLVEGPLVGNRKKDTGYRVVVNPNKFPHLLASCDWVVTNGGGCFFEALFLDKATFVLPQSNAEMKIANYVQEKGAVLGIGIDQLRRFRLDELIPVSDCGRKLIDGGGARRISGIIRKQL